MARLLARILAPALIAAALPALAVVETREVGAFRAFSLAAPIDVDLALADRESVTLEGDEKLIARLEAVVEDGVLKLRTRRGMEWNWQWGPTEGVRARVTAKRLDAVSISGAGDIRVSELRGESVALTISGSGDVDVRGGRVGSLDVTISGSGDIRSPRLEAQRVSVSISGSGDATVWARESLSVKVAGSGDVRFYGDPALQSRIAGSGEVRRLGAAPG
jgi:hypothetical protein